MLFLIDFGLAKKFRNLNGSHIEPKTTNGMIGYL